MKTRAANLMSQLIYPVPPEFKAEFKADSIERNIRRFSILPYFNIVTQVACIFIYLQVYPAIYPERNQADPASYLALSLVYCAVNLAAAIVFFYLRRHPDFPRRPAMAAASVYIYIMCYVVLEASQVPIELEISGNIYRFLATFFIVSFFPVIGRLPRLLYMGVYIAISEAALAYMASQGIPIYSYPEINAVLFVVCLIASNVYYNSVIRNFALRKQLEYLSSKDELTGLYNRRSLNGYVQQCWNTAVRMGGALGILMVDIDHFKSYNDTYGHQAGDACLIEVAKAIEGSFQRSTDMTARYGGEEFVVVLLNTTQENALAMAERVRAAVEGLAIPHAGNPPTSRVTISAGLAIMQPQPGQSHESLLKCADDALYVAKENGRNRVEAAPCE